MNLLLGHAVVGVAVGHVGHERDQHSVILLDARLILGLGRLDAAADLAPEIELPREVEARAEDAERGGREVVQGGDVVAELVAVVGRQRALPLRKEAANLDVVGRTGGEHTKSGFAERKILVVGLDHKAVEHGIVELLPPQGVDVRQRPDLLRLGVDPLAFDGRGRPQVIRPHLHRIPPILAPRRAAAHRQAARRHGQKVKHPGETESLWDGAMHGQVGQGVGA